MSWKQVWAAAFVQDYLRNIKSPPPDVYRGTGDKAEQWELSQAASAAECAWAVVSRLKEAILRIEEGWGKDSDVIELAKQFVCDDIEIAEDE
jgi:hypothetical protein